MEPIDYLKILRRRWRVIVAALLLSLAAAWATTPETPVSGPPVQSYTATVTLLKNPDSNLPLSYVGLFAKQGEVPENVAKKVRYDGPPALLGSQLEVLPDDKTGAMQLTVADEDGARATLIANTFAQEVIAFFQRKAQEDAKQEMAVLQEQLTQLRREIAEKSRSLNDKPGDPILEEEREALRDSYGATFADLRLQQQVASSRDLDVLQEATPIPVTSGGFAPPSSRSGRLLLGLLLGAVLGCVLALVLERLDTRLRDRATIQELYRMPVLTEVPRLPHTLRHGREIIAATQPASLAAEAYRSLRSSLLLLPSRPVRSGPWDASGAEPALLDPPKVVLVASPRGGEGKTTTVVNLAACLAEAGKRVLVLDCDFRAPEAHRYLDVPEGPGLSDLLNASGEQDLLSLSRPTALTGVRLVTAGTMLTQPAALPARMAEIIRQARDLADIVLIDSAPMLLANDAIDLMPYVDSVLVVCRSGRTTTEQAERASELLARMRVPVIGLALVGVSTGLPPELLGRFTGATPKSDHSTPRSDERSKHAARRSHR